MEEEMIIRKVRSVVPAVLEVARQMWIDYDKEADVVYISFEKPQNADESEMEDDVVVHKRKNKIVGLTILNFSKG